MSSMKKRLYFNPVCRTIIFAVLSVFIVLVPAVYGASGSDRPQAIVSLPENENAIIVEKKSQTLFLFSSQGSKIAKTFEMACSTGEATGVKQEAGDKKTPEGVYFLTDEYEDRYLTPVYGKKAFPTDYPNFMDQRAGKNGSAIWIHGTNKALKPMDSNGCVALENDNILKLSDYITLDSTPVIMVDEIKTVQPNVLLYQGKKIQTLVDEWQKALTQGTYHGYLSFYSETYLPDILWWEGWVKIRQQAQDIDPDYHLSNEKMGIYHYDGIFVALFDSYLNLAGEKIFFGKRKLFLDYSDTQFKIVGDVFQHRPDEYKTAKNPLVAAVRNRVDPEMKNRAVIKTIKQWLAAWSEKDMDRYASFYAQNFYSDGLSKQKWVNRKKTLAKKYDYINVSGSNFELRTTGKESQVTFDQKYESSGFTAQGTKKLTLVDEGGLWKIYRESWKKK